jgi:hypothetical protein
VVLGLIDVAVDGFPPGKFQEYVTKLLLGVDKLVNCTTPQTAVFESLKLGVHCASSRIPASKQKNARNMRSFIYYKDREIVKTLPGNTLKWKFI